MHILSTSAKPHGNLVVMLFRKSVGSISIRRLWDREDFEKRGSGRDRNRAVQATLAARLWSPWSSCGRDFSFPLFFPLVSRSSPHELYRRKKKKKRKEDKRERSLKFAKNCFSFLLPSIFNSRIVVVNSWLIFEFSFLFGLKVERFRDQLMLF